MGPILRKDETSKIDKLGPRFQHLGPSLRKDERSTIDKLGPSFLELEPSLRKAGMALRLHRYCAREVEQFHYSCFGRLLSHLRCGPCAPLLFHECWGPRNFQLGHRGFIELISVM